MVRPVKLPQMPETFLAVDPGRTTGLALFLRGALVWSGTIKADSDPVPRAPCVVVEIPDHVRVPALDIARLAFRAGLVVGRTGAVVVHEIPVKRWKGSVSKEHVHAHALRFLRPGEIMPEDHNARDAVCLGLWALERATFGACR